MASEQVNRFLQVKAQALAARARRLSALTPRGVGIRTQDLPYAPSAVHFDSANRRLRQIDQAIAKRLQFLQRHGRNAAPQNVLLYAALVEREIDRARRTFGMFFEVFSQRGSAFAPALAAHDVIAANCYEAIREAAPLVFAGPLVKPLTYMEHGYSPATMRRGVTLNKLLGERNPFPLIRIPWDRDNPWQSVFLHEVSHNLCADLGLWHENKDAVNRRLLRAIGDPVVVSTYGRWSKEIFADLSALLLGGPASAWGMMDFLAHPAPKVMTYKPGGAHPTSYLRALILAEMLDRMGFDDMAGRVRKVWTTLYKPSQGHRIPGHLLRMTPKVIPHVVDEIAFQTRRNLAQRALADVIRYTKDDERIVRRASAYLARGVVPNDVPPRFLVSASRYALSYGGSLPQLSKLVIRHLSAMAAQKRGMSARPGAAAA